jgi:hypothetical protein
MAEHAASRSWLETTAQDADGGIVLCWPVLYAFVRLTSNTRSFGADALRVRDSWSDAMHFLAQPRVRLVGPGERHREIASELAATPGLRSDDVPDVQLAALAIEHGLVLATHDHGFGRFTSLRWIDPLG